MKRLFLSALFVSFGVALTFSNQSFAQSFDDGQSGALQSTHEVYQRLSNADLQAIGQFALNSLVKTANQTLADHGYVKEARQYQSEWDGQGYSTYLLDAQTASGVFGFYDVGDHQPLNAWLADFYKKLEDKLGDPILKMLHLDDINTMNYAIPVVFQPKGDKRNGDHWDGTEYGKHFVPFAAIVTYWGAYIGCMVATQSNPAIHRFCGTAAGALRMLMTKEFAPKLSKVVYTKTTGRAADDLSADFASFDKESLDSVSQIPRQ